MKTPVITRFAIVVLCASLLLGCKKSAVSPTNTACQSAASDNTAYTNALKAYSQNPTKANCEAYKTALTAYFNKISPCVGQSGITQQQINQTKADIANIQCP